MELIIILILVFISLIIIILIFYKFIFLRDPKRKITKGQNILAPADGKIIEIVDISKNVNIKGEEVNIKKYSSDTLEEGYFISIFMSLFNVHVNRAPIDGKINFVKHSSGTFVGAYSLKSLTNEKNEIIIKNKKIGKVKVIQIAGFLARRIECFVKKNQYVNKGEKIGLIKLGSNVSLIIPQVKLLVKKGDKVKAGVSVIAKC